MRMMAWWWSGGVGWWRDAEETPSHPAIFIIWCVAVRCGATRQDVTRKLSAIYFRTFNKNIYYSLSDTFGRTRGSIKCSWFRENWVFKDFALLRSRWRCFMICVILFENLRQQIQLLFIQETECFDSFFFVSRFLWILRNLLCLFDFQL